MAKTAKNARAKSDRNGSSQQGQAHEPGCSNRDMLPFDLLEDMSGSPADEVTASEPPAVTASNPPDRLTPPPIPPPCPTGPPLPPVTHRPDGLAHPPSGGDPFSLDAISLGDDYADAFMDDDGGVASVPVRKPARDWFIRCHPEHWRNVRLLEVKEGPDRGYYLVARDAWDAITGADLPLKPFRLTLAISRDCGVFFWPLRLTEHANRRDDWSAAALRIAKTAETTWVKIYAREGANTYSHKVATGAISDPVWPQQTFQELVDLAFDGRKIADRNDPLVRRLLGES